MIKTIKAHTIKVKARVVHGCHDCPYVEYRGGMSDSRGHFCLKQDEGWGTMVNREVEQERFHKGCPL